MDFNDNQKEAINFYKGCCNVIASAGSGKTGVLVNRITNLIKEYGVNPQNILAVTFSKKAKENISNRLEKLIPFQYRSVSVDTFHSLGCKVIQMFGEQNYEKLTYDWKKAQMLSEIYKNKYGADADNINNILQYISIRKNNLVYPNESTDKFKMDQENNYLYDEYEKVKQKENIIDYDDMLTKAYEILRDNPLALEYCQKQYQFVLVDEIQDINKAQYEIVKLICKESKNLFVVGDMLQNIFEWRGSSNKFILDFKKDWKNTKVINLTVNYRSTKDIVAFSNYFAKNLPESKIEDYKDSESDKLNFKQPEWKLYKNEFDEAEQISNKIKELIMSETYNYQNIAILARTNAQLQTFETSLFNVGIPYQIVDGQSFMEKKEIKIILSYLKLANNINDDDAFEYIFNKPNRWLGKQFLNEVKGVANRNHISLYCAMFKIDRRYWKFKNGINEICNVINNLKEKEFKNVKQQIHYIRDKLDIDKFISSDINIENDTDKIENLNSLETFASKYKTVKEFIEYMDSLNKQKNTVTDCVQLMTIHKAKGLEFPVVFLIGLNEGTLPHYRNENVNEEMRLAYVAITRAENELYCSSTKSLYGKSMEVSSFKEMMFGKDKNKKGSK